MHNVFISYHHDNDQTYKEELLRMNALNKIFNDYSVTTGDISDSLSDEAIRTKIRDEYLKDSTVTILLVGLETWARKHIDWELYSSMFDGSVNKKSGILVINLPSISCEHCTAAHPKEKELIYPEHPYWTSLNRSEYEERYPLMPDRIIDNLVGGKAKISVTPWSKIQNNPAILKFLIDSTHNDRVNCEYDLSRSMRRSNSS